MSRYIYSLIALLSTAFLGINIGFAAITDHKGIPPTLVNNAHPNVLINMSIETPMQGAGYNDQNDTADGGSCTGRPGTESGYQIGACYFESKSYLGYFDANKCYTHNGTYFVPAGATSATHTCSGQWSGNFLNWATMTAIDEFRWVMTGGNRVTDTAGVSGTPGITVIQRANMTLGTGHNWFPIKKLDSTINVAPSSVTPYADSTIYITSNGYTINVGTGVNNSTLRSNLASNLAVSVQVCKPDVGSLTQAESLEENCVGYAHGTYKPEGLIQENASSMRFALMSYLRDNSQTRDGGVLRANMKYVGPTRFLASGVAEANTNKEWDGTTGVQLDITDPDFLAGGAPSSSTAVSGGSVDSDIGYSGVINYINKFGANGYKSYDPIGELFYECLNYYKNRSPTAEYSSGIGATEKDNFPVINQAPDGSTEISSNFHWIDPITSPCQRNFIVGINDANPWLDKRIPGTYWTAARLDTALGCGLGCIDAGDPSNPDTVIQSGLEGWMQRITNNEGITSYCVGAADQSTWDGAANYKTVSNLYSVMGTCPYVPKHNTHYIAGLAYHANTDDIRGDIAERQTVTTFLVDTQEYSTSPLTGNQNMLWLAAKYGGFTDDDGVNATNDVPNLASEWDEDGDGVPDNYVLASSPENLINGLRAQFTDISTRLSSGAAAAVISNGTDRVGIRMQALYQPEITGDGGSVVQWVGYLQSIFIDGSGNYREDANSNGQLDNVATDPIIQLVSDDANGTQVYYCDGTTGTSPSIACNDVTHYSTKPLSQLKPVWAAEKVLSALDNSTIETQRAYNSPVDPANNTNGRHIITWLDDGDNTVGASETVAFTDATFTNTNYHWLGIEATSDTNGDATIDETDADNIVNYVRGKENITPTMRSRTLTISGTATTYRLGDMIHSAPVAVDVPNGNWDTLYGDQSYSYFRNQYADRRQVVYVGGNDGMIHAFNSGFYSPVAQRFYTSSNGGTGSETPHILGAELWAYVPKNLLPHLQWLGRLDYPHVYYVDGDLRVFDANIFTSTGSTGRHPYGWGTILVATMRFGGNPITYDHDGDGGATTPDITARSAIMIFDVTNPEEAPRLLAEYTDPAGELGFTTSTPVLTYQRSPNADNLWTSAPSVNNWALMFGSGPTSLATATTSTTKAPYLYRLNLGLNADGKINIATSGTVNPIRYNTATGTTYGDADVSGAVAGEVGSFVGRPQAIDWDRDYHTDALYYGIASGDDPATQTGKLKRLNMPAATSSWNYSSVVAPSQPFLNTPITVQGSDGSRWVYAGTGRFLVSDDTGSTTQQSYYGVKEAFSSATNPGVPDNTTYARGGTDLLNVTGYESDLSGTLTANDVSNPLPGSVTTFNGLVSHIAATYDGWYRDFTLSPNERTIFDGLFTRGVLVFPTYLVSSNVCDATGDSRVYGLYYKTGTNGPRLGISAPTNRFDLSTAPEETSTYVEYENKMILGLTPGPAEGGISGSGDDGSSDQTQVFGETMPTGRQSWREIILE